MPRYTMCIERDKHVDRRCWCFAALVSATGLLSRRKLRRARLESPRQHVTQLGRIPCNGHAIWKCGIFDDEDVSVTAEAEEHGRLREFVLARCAEAVSVSCSRYRVSHRICAWDTVPLNCRHAKYYAPLLKHRIFTWLPSCGSARASTVGAKNIASSSGWAIKRQMRLLRRRGKDARAMWAV